MMVDEMVVIFNNVLNHIRKFFRPKDGNGNYKTQTYCSLVEDEIFVPFDHGSK